MLVVLGGVIGKKFAINKIIRKIVQRQQLSYWLELGFNFVRSANAVVIQEILLPSNKTFKASVLPGKSIFSVDAKAITSNVDVQKVQSGIFEFVKGQCLMKRNNHKERLHIKRDKFIIFSK